MGWLGTSERPLRQWEQLVEELEAHNGSVELGLPGAFEADIAAAADPATDETEIPKSWRVRLLATHNDQWIVERPPIVGRHTGGLIPGVTLIGVIVKKSKRWSFRTSILRSELFELNAHNRVPALRLSPPRDIGSDQRRHFYRVSTIGAGVPPVNIWPLLDPASCIVAEDATQLRHLNEALMAGLDQPAPPQLGDGFVGNLVDISAGGVALSVSHNYAKVFDKHHLFWLELMLATNVHPLVLAGEPVHVRHDRVTATLNIGMSFYHEHNEGYRRFIQENICRYAAWEQRRQLQRNVHR